jgi:KaiC/GvpD/RAD55 family RecA-like ATPase
MITTGSKRLDVVTGFGSGRPVMVAYYGASGSGKSQVLYTTSVLHAATIGYLILVTFFHTPPAERLYEISTKRGFDSSKVLEKIIVIRAGSQLDLKKLTSSVENLVSLTRMKLILVDNIAGLTTWVKTPAELSYLLSRLSFIVNRYGTHVVLTYPVRFNVDRGEEEPLGYEYSWPYVDRFVKLVKIGGGVFLAKSNLGEIKFRISGRGVEDFS